MARSSAALGSLLLLCLSAISSGAQPATIEEHDGNIYFHAASGERKQITNTGRDRSPSLSLDRKQIIFIRNLDLPNPAPVVGDAVGPEFGRSQLWLCQTTGNVPPKLILDSPVVLEGRQFFGFYAPQFSPNADLVYFQIAFSASSDAIVRLTVATKNVAYLTNALDFAVVPAGRYEGDLIAKQHRPKLALGYYDWYLLNPSGQQIGIIGQDKTDVSNFLDLYVGDATAPSRLESTGMDELHQPDSPACEMTLLPYYPYLVTRKDSSPTCTVVTYSNL